MKRKSVSRVVAVLLVGIVCLQVLFGGINAFASSVAMNPETNGKTEAVAEASGEKAETTAKPEATKPDGEPAKPEATKPEGEAVKPEIGKPDGEATKPEGEPAKPETGAEGGETPKVVDGTGVVHPTLDADELEKATDALIASAALEGTDGEEKDEYIITINDPYRKEVEEASEEKLENLEKSLATLGYSGKIEDFALFEVSYVEEKEEKEETEEAQTDENAEKVDGEEQGKTEEDEENKIIVKDGDTVPKGTKLTIVAKPMFGGMTKVFINDEEHTTKMGRFVENEYTVEVTEDTYIGIESMISMLAITPSQYKDGGTANRYYTSETNATTQQDNNNLSGTYLKWRGTHGNGCQHTTGGANPTADNLNTMFTLGSHASSYSCGYATTGYDYASSALAATSHYWRAWDSFNVTLAAPAGTVDATAIKLTPTAYSGTNARSLTITGTGAAGATLTLGGDYKKLKTVQSNIVTSNIPVTMSGVAEYATLTLDSTVTHGAINIGAGTTLALTGTTLKASSITIDGATIVSGTNFNATGVVSINNAKFSTPTGAIGTVTAGTTATVTNQTNLTTLGAVTGGTGVTGVTLTDVTTTGTVGDITATTGAVSMTRVTSGSTIGNITATTGAVSMTRVTSASTIGNITATNGAVNMDTVTSASTIGDISGGSVTMNTVRSTGAIGNITASSGAVSMTNVGSVATTTIGAVTANTTITMTGVTATGSIGGTTGIVARTTVDMTNVTTPAILVTVTGAGITMNNVKNGGAATSVPLVHSTVNVNIGSGSNIMVTTAAPFEALTATGTINITGNNTIVNVTASAAALNTVVGAGATFNVGGYLLTRANGNVGTNASRIGGIINIPTSYGNIHVEAGSTGTIEKLYGNGYVLLQSNAVAYTHVFGGGTSSNALGNYTGAVTITINAAQGITGQLYGGGDSLGCGDILYNITGGTIAPNIYGGSLNGDSGAIVLDVKNLDMAGTHIYGGGHGVTAQANAGSTHVKITGNFVTTAIAKTIYGGGHGASRNANVTGASIVDIARFNDHTMVYGGGHAVNGTATAGSTNVTVANKILNNVYGGGNSANANANAAVIGSTVVNIPGEVDGNVFGGGTGTTAPVGGLATVNVANTTSYTTGPRRVAGNLYGGGDKNPVNGKNAGKSTIITVTSGSVGTTLTNNLYGGSLNSNNFAGSKITLTTASLAGNLYGGGNALAAPANLNSGGVDIEFTGTTVKGNLYGGGIAPTNTATVIGDIKITGNATSTINGSFYGGGMGTVANSAKVTGNVITRLTGTTVDKDFFGGGTNTAGTGTAPVTGYTDIKLTNSVVKLNLYGGGDNNTIGGKQADGKAVTIVLDGTKVGTGTADSLYGGGLNGDLLTGGTRITVKGANGALTGNLYGGGHGAAAAANIGNGGVDIEFTGTTIKGSLYGGGHALAATTATVTGDIKITGNATSTINGSFYGGGIGTAADSAKVTGNVITRLTGTTVDKDFFGGGTNTAGTGTGTAPVTGYTDIKLTNSVVKLNLYGGGDNNTIGNKQADGKAVTILLDGTKVGTGIAHSLYGGGLNGDLLTGGTRITVKGVSILAGNLYGGGNNTIATPTAKTNGDIDIIVEAPVTIGASLYGGGTVSAAGTNADVSGFADINMAGQITDNLHGGGTVSVAGGSAKIGNYVDIVMTGTAGQDLYGGGTVSVAGGIATVGSYVDIDMSGTVGQDLYGGGTVSIAGGSATVGSYVDIDMTGKVTGSLYGGGKSVTVDEATIGGYVDILVGTGAEVGEDLYGGGENNSVINTTPSKNDPAVNILIMQNAKINGAAGSGFNTYGGAYNGTIGGNVVITTETGSHVYGNLYGGGNGAAFDATVQGHTHVLVKGSVHETVYGGGINNAPVDEYTVVDIKAGNTSDIVHDSVYGGGSTNDAPVLSRDSERNTPNKEGYSTKVTIEGYVKKDVYGGSRRSEIRYNTWVKMNSGIVNGTIYGASHDESGHNTDIHGITLVQVYGGNVQGASTTANGAVFGGGSAGSEVLNTVGGLDLIREYATTVWIEGSTVKIDNNVHGGGEKVGTISPVHGSSLVEMREGTVNGDIFGGGFDSETWGYTRVNIGPEPKSSLVCKVTGTIYGGGVGANGIVDHNYGTYVLIRDGAEVGWVYGGGKDGAHVTGNTGTGLANQKGTNVDIHGKVLNDVFGGGLKADVQAKATDGTWVIIHSTGIVGNDVFGGGNDGDILGTEATDVEIYGTVGNTAGAYKGNVYGGGFDGDVTEERGPRVLVSRQATAANSGFVSNNVYGGGFGSTKKGETKNTNVTVNEDSTVQHSVFGGGRGPGRSVNPATTLGKVAGKTNVEVTGVATLIGNRNNATNIFAQNNYVTRNKGFMFRGENETTANVIDDTVRPSIDTTWMNVGNVYGGGSWAEVGSDTNVNIHDMDQKGFNRISGGNLGIVSSNQVREVEIARLGVGYSDPRKAHEMLFDELRNILYYTNLDAYTAVRFLQDYSTTEQNSAYLTVYYNLKSTDDGETIHGIANNHASTNNVTRGTYHSWRPKTHTTVIIEPKIVIHQYAKFRMEANYTVDLKDGIFTTNKAVKSANMNAESTVTLILDPAADENHVPARDHHDGSTTKIYGPDNNVMEHNIFGYEEILRMLVPTNLKDRGSSAIVGINLYIPPMEVKNKGIEDTNFNGTSNPDRGGNAETIPAIVSEPTDIRPVVETTATKGYYTNFKNAVSANALIARLQALLQNPSSKKIYNIAEKQAGIVSVESLKALAKEAGTGATVNYYGDTVDKDGQIEARMYINTSKLDKASGNIATGVRVTKDQVAVARKIFKQYFQNKFAVVSLNQTGIFGTTVKVAAKVDLGDLDKENLMFYAYSVELNKFTLIKAPKYYIDANNYVHFYTDIGGDIIITDSKLVLK